LKSKSFTWTFWRKFFTISSRAATSEHRAAEHEWQTSFSGKMGSKKKAREKTVFKSAEGETLTQACRDGTGAGCISRVR